tara:strand:- start:19771 stop:20736 length:966 start_codon:yes stop_codon:yes gene_type:complete
MAMTTSNTSFLQRAQVYSSELKEILRDEMMAQRYVRMLDGFPDGNTFNIPSIGQAQVDNYSEDSAVTYRPLDTGNFTFTVDKYLSSATYMTKKAEQDTFYSSELMSRFVPEQERAIMEHFETTTLAAPESGVSANSAESINSVSMRVGSTGTGEVITLKEFAYARFALKKQNVPDSNLVAIVDPSVEYTLNTLSNIVNVSNNPRFEGLVRDGIATGMRFVANVYGFDVYCSNFLPDATDNALPDLAGANQDYSSTNGKVNLFFSADQSVNPFIGAFRQQPQVDYDFNKDFQRHEFVTTARYGVKLYRPENMVRVVTKPTVA